MSENKEYGVPDDYKLVVSEDEQKAKKNAVRRREQENITKIKNKPRKGDGSNYTGNGRLKRLISALLGVIIGITGYVSIADLAKRINASNDAKQAVEIVQEFDKKKEFIMDSPFYTDEMDYEKLEWKELSIEEKEQLMSDLMESISTYAELRGVERTIDQEQTYYAACEKIDKFDAKTVYNGIIEKKIKQIFGEDVTVIHSCNWNKDDGINLIAIRIITKEGKEIFFGDDDIDSTLKAAIESLRTYEDSENDVDGKFEFLQEAFEFVNYEFKLNDKGDKIKRDRNAEKANKDIAEQSTYIEYDEK